MKEEAERERTMENSEESSSSTRPSIGFPLGLALLLILLFCISGALVFYLKWLKLGALILQSSYNQDENDDDSQSDNDHSPGFEAAASPVVKPRQKILEESLPVLMPGNQVPRFIAMACPCEPPIMEKITIKVQKPPADLSVPFY